MESEETKKPTSVWERLRARLAEKGVYIGINQFEDLEDLGLADLEDINVDFGSKRGGIKVVCVPPDLKSSADKMKESPRDQVVMVRVDDDTRDQLDAWVKTGAVKSRSEAAALFIREGLAVRVDELEQLRGALSDVEAAQERLRDKARQVFGGGDPEATSQDD